MLNIIVHLLALKFCLHFKVNNVNDMQNLDKEFPVGRKQGAIWEEKCEMFHIYLCSGYQVYTTATLQLKHLLHIDYVSIRNNLLST